MTVSRPLPMHLALLLLPAVIYAAGVAEIMARSGVDAPPEDSWLPRMALVAVAPVATALFLRRVAPNFDLVLFSTAATLSSIGATSLLALATLGDDEGGFYGLLLARHQLFIAGGFVALAAGAWAARHLDRIRPYPYSLAFAALLLTVATVVLGQVVNGARLWLQLGPLRFQPSEIARILLAAFVAIYLFDRRHLVADSWRIGRIGLPPAPYLIPLAAASLAAVAVLVLQNDLGMAALMATSVVVMIVSILQSRASAVLALVLLGISCTIAVTLASRLRDRVGGWLDPWQSPTGTGFQFLQGDYAAAAGGVLGARHIASAVHVPEVHTDFVLVGIGAYYGILGASAVVVLSAVLVCRCAQNAMRGGESFPTYFGLTLAVLLGIQQLLILGGSLRVLPLTGLTLPLVSYGGTSLLVTFFILGLILGIGSRRTEIPGVP